MARQTPGNYVPLDVNYARDSAIRRAGVTAELLYVRSLAYCKGARKDGHVPEYDLPVVAVGMRGVRQAVDALVREGLWDVTDDGWLIRSWVRWNGSDQAFRQERSESGKLGNHRRWHVERGVVDPDCDLCSDRSATPNSDRTSESLSDPSANRKGREGKGTTTPTVSRGSSLSDPSPTTADLLGEWIDHCKDRPPSRVIGQVSREVKTMLDEGIPYADVRAGLAAWHSKALHPSALASVVHEVRQGPTVKRSTTDQRVAAGGDLIAHFAQLEAQQQQRAIEEAS